MHQLNSDFNEQLGLSNGVRVVASNDIVIGVVSIRVNVLGDTGWALIGGRKELLPR